MHVPTCERLCESLNERVCIMYCVCTYVHVHVHACNLCLFVCTFMHVCMQACMCLHGCAYDLVPKGAQARGYALQLKIKHC